MDAPRQDAWKDEEDKLLAHTVLQYIREGHTQLEAFQEVARRLNRTPAACGFRWNATVRKRYQNEIKEAKQQRTTQKAVLGAAAPAPANSSISLDDAILFLKEMKQQTSQHDQEQLQARLYQLNEENVRLKNQIKQWEEAWTEIDKLTNWVKDRYQSSS
ncbi:RsfA family transcriptional regulator [Halobacillus sp. Marseille-Q1614]|uniref:RsfA family transcriptional regulator n=1 Tax=Halobacillus sp. Marseille-Q1614 TaxID=2709134 RepID=UPI00156D9E59|nr:RsfA family transcriptional regulator [Halobacillus sp. Marseille-Q1614]